MGYYLSFTGSSFGAWLAEQSTYFCRIKEPNESVQAVTFDSPGSFDIIEQMYETNIINKKVINDNPAQHLDVKTYLFAPNFLNTCNKHLGQVFRFVEEETSSKENNENKGFEEVVDKASFPQQIWDLFKGTLKKLYDKFLGSKISKFFFYFNGLRNLFNLDFEWLLSKFDSLTGEFKIAPNEVERWPKIDFSPRSDSFSFKKIDLLGMAPFCDYLKKFLQKPFGWLLDETVKKIAENCLSGAMVIINIVFELMSEDFNDDQMCSCIEFDEDGKMKTGEVEQKNVEQVSNSSFMMKFSGHYELKLYDEKVNILYISNRSDLDYRIHEFYFNSSRFEVGQLGDQFRELKSEFRIYTKGEKQMEVRIESFSISVEKIFERFLRLEKIYTICQDRFIPLKMISEPNREKKNEKFLDSDFGGKLPEQYLETSNESDIFNRINQILDQNGFAYIHGESGNGKTTMARAFAYQALEKYFILFFESNNSNSILTQLSNQLLTNAEIKSVKNNNDIIECIRKRLNRENSKKILFIFDNVNTYEDVSILIDSLVEHKFLITTKWPRIFQKKDPDRIMGIEKKSFCQEDYLKYLEKSNVLTQKNEFGWVDLFKRLNNKFSIIDLENGIYHYNNNYFCTFDDVYRFIINKRFEKFKNVKTQNPKAFEILINLTYLDKNCIDFGIIKIIFGKTDGLSEAINYLVNNGFLKVESRDYLMLKLDMHEKIQYQLDEFLCSDKTKNTKIENVIKKFQFHLLNNKKIEKETIESINKHLINIDKKWSNGYNSKVLSDFVKLLVKINEEMLKNYNYIVKLLKLELKNSTARKNDAEISTILLKQSEIYRQINERYWYIYEEQFQDSLICYQKLLEIAKRKPVKSIKTYNLLKDMGVAYLNQGRVEKSIEYLNKSLNLQKKSQPNDKQSAADILKQIGKMYARFGQLEESLKYFNQSLEIEKTIKVKSKNTKGVADVIKSIGEAHLQENVFQNLLGSTDLDLNQNSKSSAMEYFNQALELLQKYQESNEQTIAEILNDIGASHLNKNEPDKALEYYEKSFNFLEKMEPKNELILAFTILCIGICYFLQNKPEEAFEQFNKSLEIQKNLQPKVDVLFMLTYIYISFVYLSQGRLDKFLESLKQYFDILKILLQNEQTFNEVLERMSGRVIDKNKLKDAFEIWKHAIGAENTSTANSEQEKFLNIFRNVAENFVPEVENDQNELDETFDYFNKLQSNNKNDNAEGFFMTGCINLELGQFENALEYFNKTLQLLYQCEPNDEEKISQVLFQIGLAYKGQDEFENALEYFNKTLQLLYKLQPNDEEKISQTLICIGVAYQELGQFENALEYFNKSLQLLNQLQPNDEEKISQALICIGLTYEELGQFENALEYFNKTLQLLYQCEPNDEEKISLVLFCIGMAYEKLDQLQNALKFYRQTLELRHKINPNDGESIADILDKIRRVTETMDDIAKNQTKNQ